MDNNEVMEATEVTDKVEVETEAAEAVEAAEVNETVNTEAKSENFFTKCLNSVKGVYNKCVNWFKEKTKNVKWKEVWDKFTTGLLILLMCSPLLILGYILLWFLLK